MDDTLYSIALTLLPNIGLVSLHQLYGELGSATDIMEHKDDIRDVICNAPQKMVDAFKHVDMALKRAEEEMKWAEEHKVRVLTMADADFPQRLIECDDAPTVLYYRGSANLNAKHVISVIGTRRCTPYGQDIIKRLAEGLKDLDDTLVISGMAYGVDINAHREAMVNGIPTLGVMAHGLDMIYPSSHRNTAIKMIENGGILTEYTMGTALKKGNFVQRNRIVAGMADATILIESAEKGGGLITLGIARDYSRDTFAFPGSVNAEYSKGCNRMIRENKAALITSANDLIDAMMWDEDIRLKDMRKKGIERQMFPQLTDDEQLIVDALAEINDLTSNIISVKTGLSVHVVMQNVFSLEMKGVVKSLAGGTIHLIGM